MKFTGIEDVLAFNAPHIQLLKTGPPFILGAIQSDYALLFNWVKHTPDTAYYEFTDDKATHHRFRYLNNAPLNDSNFDRKGIAVTKS